MFYLGNIDALECMCLAIPKVEISFSLQSQWICCYTYLMNLMTINDYSIISVFLSLQYFQKGFLAWDKIFGF